MNTAVSYVKHSLHVVITHGVVTYYLVTSPQTTLSRRHLSTFIEGDWDLAVFHPPCTDLAISGAAHFPEKIKDGRQQRAIEFVERLYKCGIPRICIENPVGVLSTKSRLGKPTQYVQPYEFGHYETKKTGLWLRGLDPLVPTDIKNLTGLPKKVTQRLHYLPPSKDRWKIRSTTYQGIANAMAEQWG